MSGRIYDIEDGVPICNNCGNVALRSEETNFNGQYCPNCDKFITPKKFDTLHPIWLKYKSYLESLQGKLVKFGGFKQFKKDNGIS